MIKKTVIALSVATLATGAIALPTAVSKAADTSIQIAAACNPCAPKACGACNPCTSHGSTSTTRTFPMPHRLPGTGG